MANYATLKAAIEAAIYENHDNEITGDILQETLIAMVNSLGSGYQFVDIATPTTNPGTPDQNVFYIAATPGTYSNFGSIVLAENEVAILKYNGTWTKKTTGAATAAQVSQLAQRMAIETGICEENGLYFVDGNLYIGAFIDSSGFTAINSLSAIDI